MSIFAVLRFLLVSLGFLGIIAFYLHRRFLLPLGFPQKWRKFATVIFVLLVMTTALAPSTIALARLELVSPHALNLLFTVGYVLMGFFSILLALVVAGDLLLLGRWFIWKKISVSRPLLDRWAPRPHRLVIFIVSLILSIIAYVSALHPVVNRVTVPLLRLPIELTGYRIALLSDLHAGLTVDRDYIAEVVQKTNAESPDLIVLVGDIADGVPESVEKILEPLSGLKARHGVYYVTGNHEYYWNDVNGFLRIVKQLGFKVLQNEHAVVRQGMSAIVLAGIPDIQAERYYPEHKPDLVETFRGAPSDANSLRVLLAHQPSVAKFVHEWGVQLMLSGHTHGGQYFPWTLVVQLVLPFASGLYDYEGMKIFVGTGAAGWGPPFRLGSSAEIPIITLERGS